MIEKKISSPLTRKSHAPENGAPMAPGPAFVFPMIAFVAGRDELPTVVDMLHKLPSSLGMSYVVIAVLTKEVNGGTDEDESKYLSALQAATSMRVLAVEDGMRVEPDRIYLAGARTNFIITNGSWRYVSKIVSGQGDGDADVLLSTLAGGLRIGWQLCCRYGWRGL
ncbi:MAG: hypothetical protein JST42_28875 [Bacteroidetes bacterium]|nr:hypothetical protein [Bacteroidota bacterium]